MHQLIPLINRLQDVWSCVGGMPVELPQLVVVGAQSAGKSSVLENIVGRDFLPRGRDIVTRRPLILQLVNTRPTAHESTLFGDDSSDAIAISIPSATAPADTDTESMNGDANTANGAAATTGTSQQLPSGKHRQLKSLSAVAAGGGVAPPPSDAKDGKQSQTPSKDGSAAFAGAAAGTTGKRDDTKGPARPASVGSGAAIAGATAGAISDDKSLSADGLDVDADGEPIEYAVFGHKPNVRFTNFELVREEISKETDRLVGTKKNVSKAPITLKIYSPHVLHLTLVDLPGMTKVPVGDQPNDIEKQIRDMIWDFISNPLSIIVAVSAANVDLANSDALKIAKEADPQGLRTIGVITKIDLMDKGTDAMDILTGKVIALQHGFVGVVNRSQHDINQKKQIRASLAAERQFFAQHAVYRPIATRCGTAYLAKRLNLILMHHIQESMPELRLRIAHNIAEAQEELESYGNPLLNSPSNLGPLLLHLLSKFCNNYCDALEGKSPDVSITQLYGGARISYIFHDVFCKRLDNINPFDELTDQDIRTAIRNATGPRPSLFIPEISFELLVKRQIERLQSPSLNCVDLVFDELKRVASQCESLVSELQRFPVLRTNVYDCVRALLEKRLKPTKTMINNLVHVELAYINTNHPDFIGGSKAVSSLMDRMAAMSNAAKAQQIKPQKEEHLKSPLPAKKSPSVSPVPLGDVNPTTLKLFGRDDIKRPNGKHSSSDDKSLVPIGPGPSALDDDGPGLSAASGGGGAAAAAANAPKPRKVRDLHLEDPKPTPPLPRHNPIQSIPTPLPTDRELIETEIIKSLISSYFNIVRKNIQDAVPKAIMYFLVNHSKQDIQSELVRTLYKESMFDGLLKEADDVSQKRQQCVDHLKTMRKALDIVNSVRDFNALA